MKEKSKIIYFDKKSFNELFDKISIVTYYFKQSANCLNFTNGEILLGL